MSDRDLCPGRGAAKGTRSRHRRFTASALDAVCSAAGCGASYSGTAAARSDVRSAPERSAFPKTRRLARTESEAVSVVAALVSSAENKTISAWHKPLYNEQTTL